MSGKCQIAKTFLR